MALIELQRLRNVFFGSPSIRWWLSYRWVCGMYKNEKPRCKECKATDFGCEICKCRSSEQENQFSELSILTTPPALRIGSSLESFFMVFLLQWYLLWKSNNNVRLFTSLWFRCTDWFGSLGCPVMYKIAMFWLCWHLLSAMILIIPGTIMLTK